MSSVEEMVKTKNSFNPKFAVLRNCCTKRRAVGAIQWLVKEKVR
jgi:hypothetical protein